MSVDRASGLQIEGFGAGYHEVRGFLIREGCTNYHYGRWDWMVTHPMFNRSRAGQIAVWREGGRTVGLATYDCEPGDTYIMRAAGYDGIIGDMIEYAEHNLAGDDGVRLAIGEGDAAFEDAAAGRGYVVTPDREGDSVIEARFGRPEYSLPDGFRVVDMREEYDLYKYGKVLWRGFDHEEREGKYSPNDEDIEGYRQIMERPNVDLDLKIAVAAPDGEFVSYCGMWLASGSDTALVEPVATDPAYRRMGLGQAAVLEGVSRCFDRGARRAVVGSRQQFYYSIGFRPLGSTVFWKKG